MASRKLDAKDLEEIHKLAKHWGKIVVRQAFGEKGPGLDVDLDMMEAVAIAAARGLTEGTLEEATTVQSAAMDDLQPCPECGDPCRVQSDKEARTIVVTGGAFEHREPSCYCNRCRRSFFPSACGPEAGHARL